MHHAHAVNHLLHRRLEAFASTLPVHLDMLLDLDETRPERVEEVRLEVVRVVLSDKLDNDAY